MHSGQIKRFWFHRRLALMLLVVLVGAVSTTGLVNGAQDAGAVEVLSTSQATKTLQQDNDSGGSLGSLLDWLEQYQQLEETRRQRRAEIYQRNIAQAKDAFAKDNITQALTFTRKASSYAPDAQQFQQLEWLDQIEAQDSNSLQVMYRPLPRHFRSPHMSLRAVLDRSNRRAAIWAAWIS